MDMYSWSNNLGEGMQKIEGAKELRVLAPPELFDQVDKIAEKEGFTRAETVRKLLTLGISIHRDCSALGIASLARVIDRATKALRKEVGQQELFPTDK